mgnify:CR=1 FL=1
MAVANGIPFNVETMRSMLKSLCNSRSCFRDIAGPLTLNVTDVGEFTVLPWEEPADRVEYFSGLVVEAGLGMTRQSAQQMLEWFCQRRVCRRGLTRPLTLAIGEVGNVTVRPFEEPAYVIERFSSAATAAGLQMNVETMLAALEWFCARRSCHRPITGPHRLVVNGVGNITVRPFQDPAAVVERYGSSKNTDLQQRCYEFSALMRSPDLMSRALPVDASCEDVDALVRDVMRVAGAEDPGRRVLTEGRGQAVGRPRGVLGFGFRVGLVVVVGLGVDDARYDARRAGPL